MNRSKSPGINQYRPMPVFSQPQGTFPISQQQIPRSISHSHNKILSFNSPSFQQPSRSVSSPALNSSPPVFAASYTTNSNATYQRPVVTHTSSTPSTTSGSAAYFSSSTSHLNNDDANAFPDDQFHRKPPSFSLNQQRSYSFSSTTSLKHNHLSSSHVPDRYHRRRSSGALIPPLNTSLDSASSTPPSTSLSAATDLYSSPTLTAPPPIPSVTSSRPSSPTTYIYKTPGHASSTSAISSASSGSRKDHSSLTSISSFGSDVTAAVKTKPQPLPSKANPLVLPSDARRSSGSSSASPSPSTSSTELKARTKNKGVNDVAGAFTSSAPYTPSGLNIQEQRSKVSNPPREKPANLITSPSSSALHTANNSTIKTAKVVPVHQSYQPPKKPAFSEKFRKAFGLGSKSSPSLGRSKTMTGRVETIQTTTESSARYDPPPRRVSSLNPSGPSGDFDAQSIRSTSSISSFVTLKRMGKKLFKHKSSQDSLRSSITLSTDNFGQSTQHVSMSPVTPVVTHAVAIAEAEPAISAGNTKDSLNSLFLAPPSSGKHLSSPSQESNSAVASDSGIPSLTSQSSSNNDSNDSEELDNITVAGETVFPKNLDFLTVESIRTSLDRTKSLERRRSRRSNRSNRSVASDHEEQKEMSVPSPLEVHVHDEELVSSVPTPGTPKKSILKKDGDGVENVSPTLIDSLAIDFGDSDTDIILDLPFSLELKKREDGQKLQNVEQPQGFEPSERSEFASVHESLPSSESNSSKQQPVYQYQATQYQSSNSSSGSHHRQFHYHPLYVRHASRSSLLSGTPHSRGNSSSSKPVNVTFSSRIIIYDTYDAGEYDRRAEPATCNRLNPYLAQQIKEELNHFKLEMEVHHESRIYTHFF